MFTDYFTRYSANTVARYMIYDFCIIIYIIYIWGFEKKNGDGT